MGDPQLLGNQLRRPLAIAGKDPLISQAKCPQRGERLAASFAQVIAKENRASKHSRVGHQHWRGSLFIGIADKRFDPGDAVLPQELCIAGENLAPIQVAERAPAREDFRALRSAWSDAPPISLTHNRPRQRVRGSMLGGCCQREQFIGRDPSGKHLGDLHLALGDGAGLVEDEHIRFGSAFQNVAASHQDAAPRQALQSRQPSQ